MSVTGKKSFNIFIVFIGILLYAETVTSRINYNEIRRDDKPYAYHAKEARTTREILERVTNQSIQRPILNLQQATEHVLHFGALLRIRILDIFGPLVYDLHDDYSNQQTAALYRVYQETLGKRYNIFNIVPSVLRNPDIRPTNICRHIQKYVRTWLKESSKACMTIYKNDQPRTLSSMSDIVNITRHMYKRFYMQERFTDGFSLTTILDLLKTGTLKMTVGLMSGLVHNIQYDNFNDEVRTAERKVMNVLASKMLNSNEHKVLLRKDSLLRIHTVSNLLKELLRHQKFMRTTEERKKNSDILSEHVVYEVPGISKDIQLLGTVYHNNRIDMKYLLNLILPQDVVDEDITDAKDYLLEKINDYNIVDKYLKVEKYQQNSPDQLLLEILGQMRDIDFAVDIVTALYAHARFWRQSHMINTLNELLGLFDAYENVKKVPRYSTLMSLKDKVRNTLWNSENVTVEILCNNPRICLRIGLKTVAESKYIDAATKNEIDELFYHLYASDVIHNVDKYTLLINTVHMTTLTKQNATKTTVQQTTDPRNKELTTTLVTIPKPVSPDVGYGLTKKTEELKATETTTADQTTTEEEPTTQKTASIEQKSERLTEQSTTEEELRTQKTTTAKQTTSEEKITTYEAATTERESTESTEKSSAEEQIMTETTKTTTTTPGERTTKLKIADETIIPKNDDGRYEDDILNDSAGIEC